MRIAPPGWLPDAQTEPEALIKEARRRQRAAGLRPGWPLRWCWRAWRGWRLAWPGTGLAVLARMVIPGRRRRRYRDRSRAASAPRC